MDKNIIGIFDIEGDENITSFIKWRITRNCNYDCLYCVQHRQCLQEIKPLSEEKEIAKQTVVQINRLIEELTGNVKIDLIGGEVTLVDLVELLKLITSEKLKKIHITTNFDRPLEYFYDIIEYVNSRSIKLTLCTSYHSQYYQPEDFIKKVLQLKDYIKDTKNVNLLCETVSSHFNSIQVKQFKELCITNNISYMIDMDIRGSILPQEKKHFISECSFEKSPRYLVTYDDNSYKYYPSNNTLRISTNENKEALGRGVKVKGFYCSRDVNYIYINYNEVIGFADDTSCGQSIPIEDFHPRKDFLKCPHDACSLCGRMSHSKDLNTLKKYIFEKIKPIE